MEVVVTSERQTLDHAEEGNVLYMVSVTAQAAPAKPEDGKAQSGRPARTSVLSRGASSSGGGGITEIGGSAAASTLLDVCSLEGCGLG